MNQTKATLPLAEILTSMESVTSALRREDEEQTRHLQTRVIEQLRTRPLDSCDRMILGQVLNRIRKLMGSATFVRDVESRLSAT